MTTPPQPNQPENLSSTAQADQFGSGEKPSKAQVWVNIVVAYTSAGNTANKTRAVEWANYVAHEYERKFLV